ncbi:hypothetical protein C5L14_14825 [Labrys okinawensis]|uniref:Uncharacterized protein n=1 Tax=Labrys okinawensis TaxID=346911 RepID=A0A2S9QBA8_9HYPH|nr:hypothetical protein C5L14_14825 [Labrys okinawensis]
MEAPVYFVVSVIRMPFSGWPRSENRAAPPGMFDVLKAKVRSLGTALRLWFFVSTRLGDLRPIRQIPQRFRTKRVWTERILNLILVIDGRARSETIARLLNVVIFMDCRHLFLRSRMDVSSVPGSRAGRNGLFRRGSRLTSSTVRTCLAGAEERPAGRAC